jgi:hypothetical protein
VPIKQWLRLDQIPNRLTLNPEPLYGYNKSITARALGQVNYGINIHNVLPVKVHMLLFRIKDAENCQTDYYDVVYSLCIISWQARWSTDKIVPGFPGNTLAFLRLNCRP